jgi:hypothetical protein
LLCFASAADLHANSNAISKQEKELAKQTAARVRISLSIELPTEASEAVTAARASAVRRSGSEVEAEADMMGM